MKIKVLYSHLNVTGTDYKGRPSWFDFEECFKNFLKTIEKWESVTLHVVFDTSRGHLEDNWIFKYQQENIIFHEIEGGSMDKAAMEMYKIAKELSEDMNEDDLFMFQENDYKFQDWVSDIHALYRYFGDQLNYVSLYDHADKYMSNVYPDLVSKIVTTSFRHWRTTPSTCGSYICTKKIFLEDYEIHTNVIGDHNKWVYLNQEKGRFLLTPIPSLSTHCMDGLLSPCINWDLKNI